MPGRFALYLRLLAKVEGVTRATSARRAADLSCRPGCSGCCQVHLSLSPVEASYLAEGIRDLSPEQRAMVLQNAQRLREEQSEGPCPLLLEDRCALYERRPLICRTHGLPVTLEELRQEGRLFDVCPLNFNDQKPSREDIIDLDTLNALLFTVNALFCEENGLSQERVLIAEALLRAAEES